MKYIECRHTALVRCKYKDALGISAVIDFYPFILDKYTGQPRHTGFTEVSKDVLEALKRDSNVFKSFIKKKLLVELNELPASAQTPSALLAAKEQEVYDLKALVAEKDALIETLQKKLSAQGKKLKVLDVPKDKDVKKSGK